MGILYLVGWKDCRFNTQILMKRATKKMLETLGKRSYVSGTSPHERWRPIRNQEVSYEPKVDSVPLNPCTKTQSSTVGFGVAMLLGESMSYCSPRDGSVRHVTGRMRFRIRCILCVYDAFQRLRLKLYRTSLYGISRGAFRGLAALLRRTLPG
jgi:hypothetical protein